MVNFTLEKLNELLESLKGLPRIKEISALRKRLKIEKKKISKPVITIPEPEQKRVLANRSRSTKMRRNWRYVKLIRDNFPNLSIVQIRKQLTQRQQGKETSISDAVWQNPSP